MEGAADAWPDALPADMIAGGHLQAAGTQRSLQGLRLLQRESSQNLCSRTADACR